MVAASITAVSIMAAKNMSGVEYGGVEYGDIECGGVDYGDLDYCDICCINHSGLDIIYIGAFFSYRLSTSSRSDIVQYGLQKKQIGLLLRRMVTHGTVHINTTIAKTSNEPDCFSRSSRRIDVRLSALSPLLRTSIDLSASHSSRASFPFLQLALHS